MSFASGIGRVNIDLLYSGLPRMPHPGEELYSTGFSLQLGSVECHVAFLSSIIYGFSRYVLHLERCAVSVELYVGALVPASQDHLSLVLGH